ncbi:MAG: CAP domain-containing protein, partial [Gammaproteobacteria bacterium]
MTLSRSTFFGVFLTAVVLAPVAWAAEDAYAILNDIRAAAGLAPLSHDARLEAAALGHARYLVANDSASHDQSPGGRKFTGERPAQRAVAAGYASRLVSENLSKGDDRVLGSLQGLMAAIYHRFGFLDPEMTHIGIGVSGEGIETGMVYLMGNNAL